MYYDFKLYQKISQELHKKMEDEYNWKLNSYGLLDKDDGISLIRYINTKNPSSELEIYEDGDCYLDNVIYHPSAQEMELIKKIIRLELSDDDIVIDELKKYVNNNKENKYENYFSCFRDIH